MNTHNNQAISTPVTFFAGRRRKPSPPIENTVVNLNVEVPVETKVEAKVVTSRAGRRKPEAKVETKVEAEVETKVETKVEAFIPRPVTSRAGRQRTPAIGNNSLLPPLDIPQSYTINSPPSYNPPSYWEAVNNI